MTEYGVLAIVAAMLTTAIAIGTPVIKLNSAITRLIVKLDNLGTDLDTLERHNHDSHRRIWEKSEEHDEKLANHETRLQVIESERKM